MAFDPSIPGDNDPVIAPPLRAQFHALFFGNAPVGCGLAWFKNLPGVPALPEGWVECNGQVLNDPESPLDGVTLPNPNGAGGDTPRFLRGAMASGGTGGAETHTHNVNSPSSVSVSTSTNDVDVPTANVFTANDASSLPSYYEVVFVMRVK